MMEFNFPINLYFKKEITKIGSRLIPEDFQGDRREVQECISRLSNIVTALGESSAKAQGLQKMITSGERLRNSDHTLYVLTDPEGGTRENGTILGMLKVGEKHLYLFDSSGNNHEVYANCILDFYVHESKQRMGLGKKLFEFMLQEEEVEPQHLAIDKPSPKLLSFLRKHYGLQNIIHQMNNFVIFEGFFENRRLGKGMENKHKLMAAGISSATSRSLSGGLGSFSEGPASPRQQQQPPPSPSVTVPFGRSTAHHPVSTMGLILQNQAPVQAASPSTSQIEIIQPEVEDEPEPVEEKESEEPVEPEEVPEPEEKEPENEVPEDLSSEVGENIEVPNDAVPCNVQAKAGGHLDLKFYHSSLCVQFKVVSDVKAQGPYYEFIKRQTSRLSK